MLRAIVEEVWTTGVDPKFVRNLGVRNAVDGFEAARDRAIKLAARFAVHDVFYDERHFYAWGRNKAGKEVHRFIVR
jgi:hypothetical protein